MKSRKSGSLNDIWIFGIHSTALKVEDVRSFFDQSESSYVAILGKKEIRTADYFTALLDRRSFAKLFKIVVL